MVICIPHSYRYYSALWKQLRAIKVCDFATIGSSINVRTVPPLPIVPILLILSGEPLRTK